VGGRRRLRRLAQGLVEGPCSGLPVVGFVDHSGRGRQVAIHPRTAPVPILGPVANLSELVERTGATDLLVALPGHHRSRRLHQQLVDLAGPSVRVHWIDDPHPEHSASRTRKARVQGIPWSLKAARKAKRALDFAGALVGLLVLLPLFAVVAVAILITSGRPVFYTQERVGRGGRIFRIVKFRSMRADAESRTGPIWATTDDSRCTGLGAWLRRTNIDELPQLFNVLMGDMSLVGPRPERPMFVNEFRSALPDYDFRHTVPGGMTGWAQVHGWRGRTSLRKRLQYDLDYIRRWSLGLDLRILFMTVQHVGWGRMRWGNRGRRTA
jgi:exopolysaccharide biosynthesis polyprenyl glycosylphosphotransferase